MAVFIAAQLSRWHVNGISFSELSPNQMIAAGRQLSRNNYICRNFGNGEVVNTEPYRTNNLLRLGPSSFFAFELFIHTGLLLIFRVNEFWPLEGL